MNFDADAFISYAHIDNAALVEGRSGWVANLERALRIRLAQRLGKESRVWRDDKLKGNEYFDETLIERLRRVAALVAVLSPRYVKSEWAAREIAAFCDAAKAQGGLRVQEKVRLFKVLKTALPLDQHPPELRSLLGYEFFKVDPATGKVRELDEIFGPEAQRDFWLKLDDLACDMANLIEALEKQATGGAATAAEAEATDDAIYVAITTADLKEQRDMIKRELEQQGHTVLPDRPLPVAAAEMETVVADALARSRMSIHLVGRTYSLVPEGGQQSLIEMQNELAISRATAGGFSRLIWIPAGLEIEDERQRRVVDALRLDPRVASSADVLETPLANLRTQIGAWLKTSERPPEIKADTGALRQAKELYLIYDKRDSGAIAPWADYLFKDFELIRSVFDGDEAEVRAFHEESLRSCSGALIFYGAGGDMWLHRKLREVRKSAGYGRSTPAPVVGVCLIAPRTPEKEQFRTHDALLLPQWDGVTAEALEPFVSRLKARPQGA